MDVPSERRLYAAEYTSTRITMIVSRYGSIGSERESIEELLTAHSIGEHPLSIYIPEVAWKSRKIIWNIFVEMIIVKSYLLWW
jgi:hypothetical protein